MKAVFAYLEGSCVKDIVAVLRRTGVSPISVVSTHAALWPMTTHARAHLPQLGGQTYADVKLEVICEDADVDRVLTTIRAHTSSIYDGNGCAFVMSLDSVATLRMSEREGSSTASVG